MKLFVYFSAAVSLFRCYSFAYSTEDRVISLTNQRYNGTTEVEFTSQALGQLDFFKLDPAPNSTTFDSWYFDAINPSTNETIVFNFEIQWPVDNGVALAETLYRVSIFGSFANGTAFSYGVDAENVNITERADKSMLVEFFGRNEFSWSGSSLLEPRPVYNVTINSPEFGITGSLVLRGNLAAPHFSCGTDAAGVEERIIPGVAWANAVPDANASVALRFADGTTVAFDGGYGYHDKTWVDRPFETALQSAFWGHARVGPYAAVWWRARAQGGGGGGVDVSSEYLARWADGLVVASRCVVGAAADNNTMGWGEGQAWPLLPGAPAPAGMALRWDLGDAGVFVANVTSEDVFVEIPFWMAGRGPVVGGFEGGEVYTDELGLWSLNQLQPL